MHIFQKILVLAFAVVVFSCAAACAFAVLRKPVMAFLRELSGLLVAHRQQMSDIREKERASKGKAVTELAKALSNTVIKTKLNGAFPELAGLINSATGPQPSQRNRLPNLGAVFFCAGKSIFSNEESGQERSLCRRLLPQPVPFRNRCLVRGISLLLQTESRHAEPSRTPHRLP